MTDRDEIWRRLFAERGQTELADIAEAKSVDDGTARCEGAAVAEPRCIARFDGFVFHDRRSKGLIVCVV